MNYRIHNSSKREARKDIRSFDRLLELVLQFEKDEWDLLEYRLRSALRYFQASDQQSDLSNLVLGFFQKADFEKADFKVLVQSLEELGKDTNRGSLGLPELGIWAEARAQVFLFKATGNSG